LRENRQLTLIATDNVPDALTDAADRVAVIQRGRLLFEGHARIWTSAGATRLDLRAAVWGHP
jgi:ABC-type multidrug transport system ATPase subunit